MNFPSLPTDNLYKFIALAGLVITLVSLIYPTIQIQSLELAVIESQAESARLEIEVAEIERLLDKEKNLSPNNVISLRERYQQSKIKQAELHKQTAITDIKLKWVKQYLIAGLVGLLLGPWIAFWGFRFWYVRIQKPLDAQIAKQSSADEMKSGRQA